MAGKQAYALTGDQVDRLRRAMAMVERGELGGRLPRQETSAPNQVKVIGTTTDLQPGTFAEYQANWYEATDSTTEPTFSSDDSKSTVLAYDLFKWGWDKRYKGLAIRPVPSRQYYLYQPPAARWGVVVTKTTSPGGSACDLVTVHPTTGPRGTGDSNTTFSVQLPMRSGKSPSVSAGDVIAYMPALSGHYVAVSDYTETGSGQAAWGKVVSYTTGAASTDPDVALVNPSTNAVGDATDTGTTYTVILPRRVGVSPSYTTGDVLAYMPSADGRYVVVSDYSRGQGTIAWGKTIGSVSTGSASTNADRVLVNPCTNAVGDATDTATTYTIILPRRTGIEHNMPIGSVIGFMPTADGGYSIVSDYSDAGSGGVTAVNAACGMLPLSTVTIHTADGTTHLQLASASWSGTTDMAGFGLETTGSVTLKATTALKLYLHFHWYGLIEKTGTKPVNTPYWAIALEKNATRIDTMYVDYQQHSTDMVNGVYGNSPGFGGFVSLTSGDLLRLRSVAGQMTANTSCIIRSGALTMMRLLPSTGGEPISWGKVVAVTTGANSTSADQVTINPCVNAVGEATDTATTYTVILPRRLAVHPFLTTGDVIAYDDAADGSKVCVSDYSGPGAGYGMLRGDSRALTTSTTALLYTFDQVEVESTLIDGTTVGQYLEAKTSGIYLVLARIGASHSAPASEGTTKGPGVNFTLARYSTLAGTWPQLIGGGIPCPVIGGEALTQHMSLETICTLGTSEAGRIALSYMTTSPLIVAAGELLMIKLK